MPAGKPYFAWIDVGETTFGAEHLRWDEHVFSFALAQEEGDHASLTIKVLRPRNEAGDAIGLLGPGRKIWCWFALDCGPALLKFRGRLVGIPTNIFEELVTLDFVAKPADVVAQKEALAATLRVLPFYDPVMIDPSRRNDVEVVLEGYSAIWHFDRETHVVTISDEITGEDGLITFDNDVLYDGLGLTLTSGPLSVVDMTAEFIWTQRATGVVDLTGVVGSGWGAGGIIPLSEGDWPKPGAGIGDGWTVADSFAKNLRDFSSKTTKSGGTTINKWADSFTTQGFSGQESETSTTVELTETTPGSGANLNFIMTKDTISFATDTFPSEILGAEVSYTSHFSRNISWEGVGYTRQAINGVGPYRVALSGAYAAERQFTEKVSLHLVADVQPILTDPEDGEALRIDDMKSVNLSDPAEGVPIGDSRRRSYISTERGNRSVEYMIAVARANLLKRARVVEIAFAPQLARMPEVTLRKSAALFEPRVGQAVGKIIGYSVALDGSDGKIKCEVRIGCTIGRGGTAVAVEGAPTYCDITYAGPDYQQFTGRTVVPVAFDSSVGYQPPNVTPNDDGMDFLAGIGDFVEAGLSVTHGAAAED